MTRQPTLWDEVDALRAENERLRLALSRGNDQTCQTLAMAMGGFPRYVDYQEYFPGATEADGVCVGDLVDVDLVGMAARHITALRGLVEKAQFAARDREWGEDNCPWCGDDDRHAQGCAAALLMGWTRVR